ncbi:MAG TPA: hypothetical protein VNU22_01100 [Candidatus Acidoferrum sp.]|nr:hypothetical protein [Candidatus Acidoferrum sp.]
MFLSLAFLPAYVIILVTAASSIKILREYGLAVVFRSASNGTPASKGAI